MPTSSIDMFLACTVILAAALIATASLCSTLQTGIAGTADTNKGNYLQAIADHIVTSPGFPSDWGSNGATPTDFGIAQSPSSIPCQVDADKISRLNSQSNSVLSYVDMEKAAKLNGIAMGISVSQILSISIQQSSTMIAGSNTSFGLNVETSINSEPTQASLNCYVIAENYLGNFSGGTSAVGIGTIYLQIPTSEVGNTLLVMFARASFDERLTSYTIYNLANATQQYTPADNTVSLTPLNRQLSVYSNNSDLILESGWVFSYGYMQSLSIQRCYTPLPTLVDKSPQVIVVNGEVASVPFQEWVAYPQIPLSSGSSFTNTEQNVFGYTVTIDGVLYKLTVSLGSIPQ